MSTTTSTKPARPDDLPAPTRSSTPRGDDLGPVRGVPFPRVLRVELRKQYDTLAGRWFLVGIAAVTAIVIVAMLLTGDGEVGWMTYLQGTSTPLSILLPIVAIMAATSEWSQRTAMTTFTLEARRGRTIWAKVISSLILGFALFVVAFALSAIAHQLGIWTRGAQGDWAWSGWAVGGMAILLAIGLLQGSAFGLALLNTPAAIVAYFVAPTAMTMVGFLVTSWQDALAWVDINQTVTPFIVGIEPSSQEWQQLGVSVALWVAVPMAIGVWRVLHREVK